MTEAEYIAEVKRVIGLSLDEIRADVVARTPFPWAIATQEVAGTVWVYLTSATTKKAVATIGPMSEEAIFTALFLARSAADAALAVATARELIHSLTQERAKFDEIRDLVAAHRDEGMARIIDQCLDDVDNPLAKTILDETAAMASDTPTLIAQIACIATRKDLPSYE